MRISLSTMYDQIVNDLQRLNSDLHRVTRQITSGKKMSSISDDPTTLTNILGLRTNRTEILQYQENMLFGSNFISATDTALNGLMDLVTEAKGIANHHLGGSYPQAEKDIAADFVQNVLDQAVSISNTQYAGKFIFGGFKTAGYTATAPAPFTTDQVGNVLYNGDPDNNLAIRTSPRSTMEISINGQSSMMDTQLFTYLKNLENALRNTDHTLITGAEQATNTAVPINSGTTGLPQAGSIVDGGTFDIIVTDHSVFPPTTATSTITINVANDLASVAAQIDAVADISATWTANGNLEIQSDDPSRFTFELTNDTSNFIDAVGLTSGDLIGQAYRGLDQVWDDLAGQITDFGLKANSIKVQNDIYDRLLVTTEDSLDKLENTDLTKAAMELKSLELAYEAALSASSKTMQLSLVDFL